MTFRVFKENSIQPDERTVATLHEAARVYNDYFGQGYSVRVIDEAQTEYFMVEEQLVPAIKPKSAGR